MTWYISLQILLCIILLDRFIVTTVFSAILRVGRPLNWLQSKPYLRQIRQAGIDQFLIHYERCQGLSIPTFLWGDEIEHGVFYKNNSATNKYLIHTPSNHFDIYPNASYVRERLVSLEKSSVYNDLPIGAEWQAEYGSWMVESVPRDVYGQFVADLVNVQKSMMLRRKRLNFVLKQISEEQRGHDGEGSTTLIAPTITTFPMLGVKDIPDINNNSNDKEVRFSYPHSEDSGGPVAASRLVSDRVISAHPRFSALTQNIRQRRGGKVSIQLNATASPNSPVELDAMAFGMGCCCLQITMQLRDEAESRFVHDNLLVLAPLLQALSASTSVVNGHLLESDTRWTVIEQAVDDRTPAERRPKNTDYTPGDYDEQLAGGGVKAIGKSRYSSNAMFIAKPASAGQLRNIRALNDAAVDVDEALLQYVLEQQRARGLGEDEVLARHLAHMFVRDPLVLFDDLLAVDDRSHLDHFENIQSTNWRAMRWKPPVLRLGVEYDKIRQQHAERDTERDADTEESFDCNILLEDRNYYSNYEDSSADSTADSTAVTGLQQYGAGWRVEFRTLEIQLTDFENAAFAVLVVLLTRLLVYSNTHNNNNSTVNNSLYVPMQLVDENFVRAQQRDAVLTQKFFFRRNAFLRPSNSSDSCDNGRDSDSHSHSASSRYLVPDRGDIEVAELTLDQIVNGERADPADSSTSTVRFPGLLPLLREYLQSVSCDDSEYVLDRLSPYFSLLSDRASGQLPTAARYVRDFVQSHPLSQSEGLAGDGRIAPTVADDLLEHCHLVGVGRLSAPGLYGAGHGMVQELDSVDEEDLMFSNSTCFENSPGMYTSPFPGPDADSTSVRRHDSDMAQTTAVEDGAGNTSTDAADHSDASDSKTGRLRGVVSSIKDKVQDLLSSLKDTVMGSASGGSRERRRARARSRSTKEDKIKL